MTLGFLFLFKLLFFYPPANTDVPKSIYDFKVTAVDGSTIDFSAFRGKKIIIMNTPAYYNDNPQYKEYEALYQKYKDKVVVIGFLDDDFGPAPGSKHDQAPAGQRKYSVTFPMAAQVIVKSDKMAPIYHWLTEKKYNNFKDSEVGWDFQKYVINEQGQLVAVISHLKKANSPELISAVEK